MPAEPTDEGSYDTYEASHAAKTNRVHVDSENYVQSRDVAVHTSADPVLRPPQGQYGQLDLSGVYASLKNAQQLNHY